MEVEGQSVLYDLAVADGEEDDVALLVLDQSPASSIDLDQPSSSSLMGRAQQHVLGAFVSRVIIRWRIPVISEYICVCSCVGGWVGGRVRERACRHVCVCVWY